MPLAAATSALRRLISARSWSREPFVSSFRIARVLISFARWANFKVERVSPKLVSAGEMLEMMAVLLLPPNESLSRKVSLLSR